MKKTIRRSADRLQRKDSWKTSAYAWIPYQTNFGALCGFADDVIAAGQGFGMHPHQDMEILTIMVNGSQLHQDNQGNKFSLNTGEVQAMSAGIGIKHSEFNGSTSASFHSYQIWIYPKVKGVMPRYSKTSQTWPKSDGIVAVVTSDGQDGTAIINQDTIISLGYLSADQSQMVNLQYDDSCMYLHLTEGELHIDGETLLPGDAIGLTEVRNTLVTASKTSKFVVLELPIAPYGIKLN